MMPWMAKTFLMSNPPDAPHVPTVHQVDEIAALPDPVIRNLWITYSYHELALAMTARTGICANWCTFATWASKQAGQTIRKEDFARILEGSLQAAPVAQAADDVAVSAQAFGSPRTEIEIQETVADLLNPLAGFDRASYAVARGNKKVFEEIGREFARFAAECLKDATFDPQKIAGFCEVLHPGDPPDGQRYLREAFTRYYAAFFEPDPKARAELIYLANVEIGFHEQTRLQPDIQEAMEAAVVDRREFRARLIKALFPYGGWLARLRLFFLRLFNRPSPFDALLDRLWAEARRQVRLVVTEYVLTISFPGGIRLHLGEDVPAEFPESLQQIVLPDLLVLLSTFDPTPDSTLDSGAVDWSLLPNRMHFIADTFRCYHESADLFEPPFTPEQIAALRAGNLPEGRL
jgi:hypothetical protein